MVYYKYSHYLKDKYNEKVYKLPININGTCPNRDGKISKKGCYFCSEVGTGFESCNGDVAVQDQLLSNMAYIGKKYKANKFIAYFQNYTNTYMEVPVFEQYMRQACIENIVEIVVSTRPDCIDNRYLDLLKRIEKEEGVNISIELGLQSINEKTLVNINRGHTVGDYIEAVKRIHEYGFPICTHLILNLPWDEKVDILNAAKLMNELKIEQVKIHSLYIAKGTVFDKMYKNGELKIGTKEEYIERVAEFLAYLSPNICLQRLLGRAPKEETVFCNWGKSWWKIHDDIMEYMEKHNLVQGVYFKQG